MKLLAIRLEQMAALQWDRQKTLREKYIARLRNMAPDRTKALSDDVLHKFCDLGVTKANSYDLSLSGNVYTFIAAMLLLGEDFDLRPANTWARDILRDPLMDEDIKAKALELRILMETRIDVARNV